MNPKLKQWLIRQVMWEREDTQFLAFLIVAVAFICVLAWLIGG